MKQKEEKNKIDKSEINKQRKKSKKKRKKNKKPLIIISSIIFGILLIISIILFSIIIKLNIIPFKYLILPIILYIVILIGIGIIAIKRKFKVWFKIFIDIISIILIAGLVLVLYYLNSTLHFMDKIQADEYQIENYYVLVHKDSEIESLEDISTLGILDKQDNKYKEALAKLTEEVEYEKIDYKTYIELGKALIERKVDSILMTASYKDIVSEVIEEFNDSIKNIYTIELKSESVIEINKKDVKEEPFNIYISGIDIYGDINSVSRSDVNMLMTVNPNTHEILLTSIPRDYYVRLHGTTGYKDKLTHAGLYGINMSIETIEDLLDEEINYYIRVNFTTLVNLVDAIGGIDIYSDTAFRAWTDHSCYFTVGNMHLGGKCALAYARERFAYQEGDRHRVRNQQDVISAIMNKALSSRTLITKYTSILESMGNSFQTNIPSESIYELINKQLETMPNWKFDTYSLNGYDSSNGTYTFGNQQLYVMEPDENTIIEARNKIDKCKENKGE